MLKLLRAQVQSVLYAVPIKRKPALRRSDASDALFATDLPLIAGEADVRTFVAEMEARGWTVCERAGWLTLDTPVPLPEYMIPQALAGESGCCISLLQRHRDNAAAESLIRDAAKAADAGKLPFERLCGRIHADFAARLRAHQPLPGGLLPYLCCAYNLFYK